MIKNRNFVILVTFSKHFFRENRKYENKHFCFNPDDLKEIMLGSFGIPVIGKTFGTPRAYYYIWNYEK
jgi:hypothetical protein